MFNVYSFLTSYSMFVIRVHIPQPFLEMVYVLFSISFLFFFFFFFLLLLFNIYAPASIDRGRIVLLVSVCPFVCLSVCLSAESLTCELNFSYNFHTIQVTMLIFSMQVLFDNTILVRVISSRLRSNVKVTFLKKWPFRGYWCFTNTSCLIQNLQAFESNTTSDWLNHTI